jgi:hypothetical protein
MLRLVVRLSWLLACPDLGVLLDLLKRIDAVLPRVGRSVLPSTVLLPVEVYRVPLAVLTLGVLDVFCVRYSAPVSPSAAPAGKVAHDRIKRHASGKADALLNFDKYTL